MLLLYSSTADVKSWMLPLSGQPASEIENARFGTEVKLEVLRVLNIGYCKFDFAIREC